MNKRGLSDVVTVGLIILLAIAGVVILWTFVFPFLNETGEKSDVSEFSLRLSVESVEIVDGVNAKVKVMNKGGGDSNKLKIKLIGVSSSSGESRSLIYDTGEELGELETKVYYIPAGFEVEKVEVYMEKGNGGVSSVMAEKISKESGFDEVSENLVGWWKFDDDFRDSSGRGNDGQINTLDIANPPLIINDGERGNVLQLKEDADNMYLFFLDSNDFKVASKTISFWAKPFLSQPTSAVFGSGANYYVGFQTTSERAILSFVIDNLNPPPTQRVDTTNVGTVVMNEFNHYTYVIYLNGNYGDPSADVKTEFYINGESIKQNIFSLGMSPPGGGFLIGKYSGNAATVTYDGLVDDLRFYNKALTAKEVKALFEQGN
jgi:hypothetical protein